MAKSKPPASRTEQKPITSFFGGGKAKKAAPSDDEPGATTDGDNGVGTNAEEEASSDVEEIPKASSSKGKAGKAKPRKKVAARDEEVSSDVPEDVSSEAEEMEADGEEDDDDDDSKPQPSKASKGKARKKAAPKAKAKREVNTGLDTTLPPIHEIPAIFSDLVRRIPQIEDVAKRIHGRKLRVATMCSGTESPLLALGLVGTFIKEHYHVDLDVEHVFSCEIEPFKQAYIERNFQPPLLFRDVCELGQSHATTAYGALAPVPGDVDILVAGTSCVDYSNLNNEKQELEAQGESGRTFRGMMSWVQNHRPPIVILENVCSAPWKKIVTYFEKIGYSAQECRVDTKKHYVPHTRTRGYLIAVNKKKSNIPRDWLDLVRSLERQASSTFDAFLLPSDDPRIHQARQKLVREGADSNDRRSGRTDWSRCESRHQRARLEEKLGSKRPVTNWEENGSCKLPDFAWNDWGVVQVERVWDLMDIETLRAAQKGIDPAYKAQVWNLSQNVDRNVGTTKLGICPCLTPSMIPYITNRGGPMVGFEALSLQGLPIDQLLLTRETEDQLADLAGNAMSTTVVGTTIVAALITAMSLLRKGDDDETYEKKDDRSTEVVELDVDNMDVDIPMTASSGSAEDRISGEEALIKRPLDLQANTTHSLPEILAAADRSARLCDCEGRKDITDRTLNRCKGCGASSCVKCGGRPEHDMEPIDVVAHPRLPPTTFASELKAILPMSISLTGITAELLENLKDESDASIPDKLWVKWRDGVLRAASAELRFVELKRQNEWTVSYHSATGRAELLLHPKQPQWRFFAEPSADEPARSDVRDWQQDVPFGRLTCQASLLDGKWEFALPVNRVVSINVEGAGDLVPAWEARLGLIGEEFKDRVVHSQLEVTVPGDEVAYFDRDISGRYILLDKCGTARGALHKKVPTDGEENLPPLFLLFDPTRTGDPVRDCFAFSTSTRRYDYGESRPVVCKLDPKWRQSDVVGTQAVSGHLPGHWVDAAVTLKSSANAGATCATPGEVLSVAATNGACHSANALIACQVPLRPEAQKGWPSGPWTEVDKVHERGTFKQIAWLIESVHGVGNQFISWQNVDLAYDHASCDDCSPSPPMLRWAKKNNKMAPIEDVAEAGEYERRLKGRPTPFVTQLRLDDEGNGMVRIGANFSSLLHRAHAPLPTKNRTAPATVAWRLQTDFVPMAKLNVPKFNLSSNRDDPPHKQPPHFKKMPLRPEQLRSLHWMIEQESPDAEPFIEEEVSEAILDTLGWRAEGRAQRPVNVRGGVLADEVGYGKTAITLGLIDSAAKSVEKESATKNEVPGKIHTNATLIVVPSHLVRQWKSETKKFTGNKFDVLSFESVADMNKHTIQDILEADILICASTLFSSQAYIANLEALAAGGHIPAPKSKEDAKKYSRYFNARLASGLQTLASQVDRLRDEDQGPKVFMEEIHAARARDDSDIFVPTKRLKGKHYRDAAEASTSTKVDTKVNSINGTTKVEDADEKVKVHGRNGNGKKRAAVINGKAALHASAEDKKPAMGPSGKVMEVVLTRRPSAQRQISNASSSAEEGDAQDSRQTARPARRAAAKRPITLSDDEEDEEAGSDFQPGEPTPPPSPSASGPSARPSDDEEYDDADVVEEEEEEASAAETESEDEKPKKGKAKAKAKAPAKKPARKAAAKSSDDDAMDEDADETASVDSDESAGSGKKRKAKDDGKPAAKKARKAPKKDAGPPVRREVSDPWKLKSSLVQEDWKEMKCPAFEMFHYARKVIDEYTYLDGYAYEVVTNLTADRNWVLSGTPPTHDFASVKSIAKFLDVHLGVDDDSIGMSDLVKKRRREQTAVEKFHSFRDVHSLEWHAHRHEIGQMFLDRFVRQNLAEIDEIPCEERIEMVFLPAAERAIYLELEHHLRAVDMTVKRPRKNESDREKRLGQSIGKSKTAEEALIKRCSHFELETNNKENAMKACEVIVDERKRQLEECKAELKSKLKKALKQEKVVGPRPEESMFREYIRVSHTEGVGDEDASTLVCGILDAVGLHKPTKAPKAAAAKGKAEEKIPEKKKKEIWDLREKSHELRRLTKELTGRVRSLRYFSIVRDLQKQRDTPPVVECVGGCGRKQVPMDEVAVLSSCGHTGCMQCIREAAEREECLYAAPRGSCRAAARILNIIKGDTLGVDDVARDGQGKHYGRKLEEVIHLIKNRIPGDERILFFVQYPDLMKKVGEALAANDVPYLEIAGSPKKKGQTLERYQEGSAERVLLLCVTDESAAGGNLTGANHAIFLSPLLEPTQEEYVAKETQAIGRVRRFGQNKKVTIWRFLSANTIDTEIFEQRTGRKAEVGATTAM